mmetsp:Transcript_17759/g.49031  ORF Transcript_17759/g.49031 Transcript_17759/m.49031 type:complete len:361 (-) Transcript_17759:125-1207(-)
MHMPAHAMEHLLTVSYSKPSVSRNGWSDNATRSGFASLSNLMSDSMNLASIIFFSVSQGTFCGRGSSGCKAAYTAWRTVWTRGGGLQKDLSSLMSLVVMVFIASLACSSNCSVSSGMALVTTVISAPSAQLGSRPSSPSVVRPLMSSAPRWNRKMRPACGCQALRSSAQSSRSVHSGHARGSLATSSPLKASTRSPPPPASASCAADACPCGTSACERCAGTARSFAASSFGRGTSLGLGAGGGGGPPQSTNRARHQLQRWAAARDTGSRHMGRKSGRSKKGCRVATTRSRPSGEKLADRCRNLPGSLSSGFSWAHVSSSPRPGSSPAAATAAWTASSTRGGGSSKASNKSMLFFGTKSS